MKLRTNIRSGHCVYQGKRRSVVHLDCLATAFKPQVADKWLVWRRFWHCVKTIYCLRNLSEIKMDNFYKAACLQNDNLPCSSNWRSWRKKLFCHVSQHIQSGSLCTNHLIDFSQIGTPTPSGLVYPLENDFAHEEKRIKFQVIYRIAAHIEMSLLHFSQVFGFKN